MLYDLVDDGQAVLLDLLLYCVPARGFLFDHKRGWRRRLVGFVELVCQQGEAFLHLLSRELVKKACHRLIGGFCHCKLIRIRVDQMEVVLKLDGVVDFALGNHGRERREVHRTWRVPDVCAPLTKPGFLCSDRETLGKGVRGHRTPC